MSEDELTKLRAIRDAALDLVSSWEREVWAKADFDVSPDPLTERSIHRCEAETEVAEAALRDALAMVRP